MKRRIALFLGLVLLVSIVHPFANALAKENVTKSEISRDDLSDEAKLEISKLISLFESDYTIDLMYSLENIQHLDEELEEIWRDIISYWDWIENEMIENIGVAPDNIKNPEKHAFIVLGYALAEDGTMQDELIGRLEVAKASAIKYPESYVLVTGGVEKNGWTEGRRMRDWLIDNGIAEERIIVEEEARNTAGNAENSFEMLYKEYDVETVSLITSQYHLKRGSIFYYTESLLKAYELGVKPITFIGEANAGWLRADKTTESMSLKARGLRQIARVPEFKNIEEHVTEINDLEILGKDKYLQGDDLDLTVVTKDSKDYNVNVTDYVAIEGYDPYKIGDSIIEVTLEYAGKLISREHRINISPLSKDLLTVEKMKKILGYNKKRDLTSYSNDSKEYFLRVLNQVSKDIEEAELSQDKLYQMYNRLNNAILKLVEYENVALGKEVFANYNQKRAHMITDGVIDLKNYWTSRYENGENAPIEDSYFIIELDGIYKLASIKIYPYWGGNRYYQYDILISSDNVSWTKVAEERGIEPMTEEGKLYQLPEETTASYIKIQGHKTYVEGRPDINNFHVVELQAFGYEYDKEQDQLINKLKDAIEESRRLNPKLYTSESWNQLTKVIDKAEETLENLPNREELTNAIESINNAIDSLELLGDKSKLKSKVDEAEAIDLEKYTEESVAILNEAINAAKEILDDEDAKQEEVDLALENLRKAVEGLEEIEEEPQPEPTPVDKSKLEEKIEEVESLDLDKYTNESVAELEKALEKAKIVLSDKKAGQEDVDDALSKLEKALSNLTEDKKDSLPKTGMNIFNYMATGLSLLCIGGAIVYIDRKRKWLDK